MRGYALWTLGSALTLGPFTIAGQAQEQSLQYPPTRKVEVLEDHFGVQIADPYRGLERLDSEETTAWVAAQHQLTFAYLDRLPQREALHQRLTELWDYPKVSLPFRQGGRLFYRQNTGLQRQSVLYARTSLTSPPHLILDPNLLSPDGAVALMDVAPSPDGRLLAYALSAGGADWQTIHVRDLASGQDLPDTLQWVRFSWLSWTKDGKGFFYSRYPQPPAGKELEAPLAGHTLYYHPIGTPQAQDPLIYRRQDLPTWIIDGYVSEDGHYLRVYLWRGADPRNRLYCLDLGDPQHPDLTAPVRPLIEADDAEYWAVGNIGSTLYLRTDLHAPNRKVVAFDMGDPDSSRWQTILPESRHALKEVLITGDRLAAQYLVEVKSQVKMFDLQGQEQETITLPDPGSVYGLSGRQDTTEFFYTFTSPLYPTTVFAYDRQTRRSLPFEAPQQKFDPSGYETQQLFATAKDGTRVPYFVTARKELTLDGTHPTLLYGYGGFALSQTPYYSPAVAVWLEWGGVYVTANIRGGGEYGEAWHQAGMLDRKQQVFDDFIAVAEDLLKRRYTSPSRLAIHGASNGGLLVGAVMTQRPELCAVALPMTGVLDMLRYDQFTGGVYWVSEYGSPADSTAFSHLRAYSPLHHLHPGTCYPATLLITADHDDRVVPSHSYKFTAALQEAQGCDRPVLLRVETQSSHGYQPTDKRIAELADMWAFALANMGILGPEKKP